MTLRSVPSPTRHANGALAPHAKPFLVRNGEHERSFLQDMHRAGVSFNERLIPDGVIHRFDTIKRGRKAGWYVFFGMAGAFGDWSRDIHVRWSVNKEHLSPHEVTLLAAQIEKSKRAAEEERLRQQEESAQVALIKWNEASDIGRSLYLETKEVPAFGVRFKNEYVLVPLEDIAGNLWSLQWINPDGEKRFSYGGRKKGCFHVIGSLTEDKPILLTEGYATGASLHLATGYTTVVAFDAGNLEPVLDALKTAYPRNQIILAADDDRWKEKNVGREKAEEAARKYGAHVILPRFQNTEREPTDFNDLHVLEGLEAVKAQIQAVIQTLEWPEPNPFSAIKKDLYTVVPLPPTLIPDPYHDWLLDIAERMQCPLDYVAVGAIIVTASLIGAGCSIRPKSKDSWTVIPNLWGGIVGAPSTLKSPALKEIVKPLESLEAEAYQNYEKAQQNHLIDLEAYKATKEAIKKEMIKSASASGTLDSEKEKLRKLQEPQTPVCKRYCTNDATIEKMHELLSHNNRGLLLFRDELMGLLASWEKEGHESDRAFFLESWNGYGSKTTDRIGRGTIHTKNLCVSVLGSTQPTKLTSYFQQTIAGLENDGLLQRFQLLVYPDPPQEWKLIDKFPNEQARQQASTIMIKIAHMEFSQYGARLGHSDAIPYFQFDSSAQKVFYEWLIDLEYKLRNSQDESLIIEHLAKYRKLMPSLALIFHLINIASGKPAGQVTKDCAARAAGWCDYLEAHVRRLYTMALSTSHQAARNVARKIQAGELKEKFDVREVYRKEWALLHNREEVQSACDVLMEHGWLKEMSYLESGKTKICYMINPKLRKRELS